MELVVYLLHNRNRPTFRYRWYNRRHHSLGQQEVFLLHIHINQNPMFLSRFRKCHHHSFQGQDTRRYKNHRRKSRLDYSCPRLD